MAVPRPARPAGAARFSNGCSLDGLLPPCSRSPLQEVSREQLAQGVIVTSNVCRELSEIDSARALARLWLQVEYFHERIDIGDPDRTEPLRQSHPWGGVNELSQVVWHRDVSEAHQC